MASIVENQRRSYQSQAIDAARVLADKLACLSEPQRAAVIAVLAKISHTPVDVTFQADLGDEIECQMLAEGRLDRASGPYVWKLDSGCRFEVLLHEGPWDA